MLLGKPVFDVPNLESELDPDPAEASHAYSVPDGVTVNSLGVSWAPYLP